MKTFNSINLFVTDEEMPNLLVSSYFLLPLFINFCSLDHMESIVILSRIKIDKLSFPLIGKVIQDLRHG